MTTSGANFPEQYNAQEMIRPDNGDDINTLIATHLNLLGERLKEISRNIENYVSKGQTPNIDRSLDIILDTVIYSSSVLLNLFETAQEIRAIAVNPQTEAEMDRELTRLAIFHLSAPAIQPLNQQRLQHQRHQNPSIVQVKTEHQ